jgi:hypothetical protein
LNLTKKPGGDAGLFVYAPGVLNRAMQHQSLRPALSNSLLGALAWAMAAMCGPAAAEPAPGFSALMSILAPQPGAKACYVRSYDAAHLRAHPKQRISAMKFLLGVKAYDPKTADKTGPDDLYYYTFLMSVARRGDKRLLTTAGDCQGGEGISCVVDCDGGSVALDKMPPADSLIVRLNDHGIQMFHDCDGGPVVWVKAGVDDKVFRLNKAAVDACKALDEPEE